MTRVKRVRARGNIDPRGKSRVEVGGDLRRLGDDKRVIFSRAVRARWRTTSIRGARHDE